MPVGLIKLRAGYTSGASWQTLAIGGGGEVLNLDTHSSGAIVCGCDSFGAFLWNGTRWSEITTSASLDTSFFNPNDFGTLQGGYAVRIAPTDVNRIYLRLFGALLKSADKGATFTRLTAFTQDNASSIASAKGEAQKIAVDPQNKDVFCFGSPGGGNGGGLYYSVDGGTTITKSSSVPAPTGNDEVTCICADPASSVSGGIQQTWYCASGGNGVYRTTTGPAGTWSLIGAGTPNGGVAAFVDSSSNYWILANDFTNVYKWNGSSFSVKLTDSSGQGLTGICVDPNDVAHFVAVNAAGKLNQSGDSGATWTGFYNTVVLAASDAPWLATTNNSFITAQSVIFHPTVSRRIIVGCGIGVFYTDNLTTNSLSTATSITLNSMTLGIENMVTSGVMSPPATGGVVCSVIDRQFFDKKSSAQLDTYPSTYEVANQSSGNLYMSGNVDYALDDNTFLVAADDEQNFGSTFQWAKSTDSGATWASITTQPFASSDNNGSVVAVSTKLNWLAVGHNNDSQTLRFTTNGGTSWSNSTGTPASGYTGGSNYSWREQLIAKDGVTQNKFYLAGVDGLYVSTNSGSSFTQAGTDVGSGGGLRQLFCVPGQAGHLFYAAASFGNVFSRSFLKSTNSGVSFSALSGISDVCAFGFGAIKPGQSYPTIYAYGYVSGVWGVYRSIDAGATWTFLIAYPANRIDGPCKISGDALDWQKCYIGYGGSSFIYGKNL